MKRSIVTQRTYHVGDGRLARAARSRDRRSRRAPLRPGLLAIVLSSRSQRLGDLAAGTFVVRAPRPQLDYFSLRTVTPLGAGAEVAVRALPGEAQRLVREFVAREAKLAPDHRARVA